jgi:leucyl aminopeptidase
MRTSVSTAADPTRLKADLVVVVTPQPPDATAGPLAALDAALAGAVAAAVADGEVRGKAGEVTVFHAAGALEAPRAAVAGLGAEPDAEGWRDAGRAVARRAGALRARRAALVLPEGAGAREARWFVEGAGAGAYRFDRFRSRADDEPAPVALEKVVVAGGGVKAAELARAGTLAAAVASARALADTPANFLTPTMLADHARGLCEGVKGLECQVLGAAELEALGAGALLGVARGSDEPPAMIVMRSRPKRARAGEVLGLVGKAVTFDSGGISIKPSGGMEEMKMDMAGGAAVIEGAALIARLGLPVEVLAVVPATENMPSGRSVKPGDVLTAMNGRTIEVVNTDAEGRLILADALVYAARNGATRLLDLATLTGAMVVALGEVYAGLFGSDAAWTERVRAAGEASGDLCWPMPLHPGYDPLVRSDVADLSNAAKKRQAGAVYAARFLRDFTEGLPWCHLDIAGTGMRGGRGSGYGVALIAALAEGLAAR